MRKVLVGLVVVASLAAGAAGTAGPASAARGRCDRDGNCSENGNRDERYDQRRCSGNDGDCTDQHRSFSPTFDKSPVDHSFNFSPTVCLPGSTCNTGGDKKDQPPPDRAPQDSSQASGVTP